MTATCYITFGQKYRNETHPVDDRAHPDGWFEYQADTCADASDAARRNLLGDDGYGRKVPLFAFDYDDQPDPDMYPRGCLARFDVHPDGAVTDGHGMTGPVRLPTCFVQYPECGACGFETDHDGDSFYCDPCGLDYGDGEDGNEATFRDESAAPCAKPCTNTRHGSPDLGTYECGTCLLPAGHGSYCWTNCTPIPARKTGATA